MVTVPQYRHRDLERREMGRLAAAVLYGYNNLCETPPDKTEVSFCGNK